jgi:hypothetical protein
MTKSTDPTAKIHQPFVLPILLLEKVRNIAQVKMEMQINIVYTIGAGIKLIITKIHVIPISKYGVGYNGCSFCTCFLGDVEFVSRTAPQLEQYLSSWLRGLPQVGQNIK